MTDLIKLWVVLAVPGSLILALSVGIAGRLFFSRRPASRCTLFSLALVAIIIAPVLAMWPGVGASLSTATAVPPIAIERVAESAIAGRTAEHSVTAAAGGQASRFVGLVRPLGLIWMLGIALASIRLVCGLRKARRLMRAGHLCEDVAILASAAGIAQRLGLKRVPQVVIVDRAVSPFVTGAVRPTIVLPTALCATLEPVELADVLTHECAHILRPTSTPLSTRFPPGRRTR